MVMMANWKDKKWQGIVIKRGQFVSSRHKLAELFGLSDQQMRTVLFKLKSTNEATSQSTSRYTLYTIVNYDKFQNEQHVINQPINQQSNRPSTTTKEVKKKEVKKKTYSEEDLKKEYPHIDVHQELLKMDAWLKDNPHRTKNIMFVRNWLNKIMPPTETQESQHERVIVDA